MTELLQDIGLWLILAWPLLVALPGVSRHLPQPWLLALALAPAALILITPGAAALDMPWIVFGSGLELDAGRRWLLGMSLLLWLAAGRLTARLDPLQRPATYTLLLITFSGQTGMILASEPVGFLCFSTLLGYGFFGLLVQGGGAGALRAARLYIVALILADLLLFEALLLAAYLQETQRFAGFDYRLEGDPATLYSGLVLLAFLLKAGIWPLHIWVTAALRTAAPPARLLLMGGPVVMALLGLWRWLPAGQGLEIAGQVCRGLGAAALVYALVQALRQPQPVRRPGWLVLALGGALLLGFGQFLITAPGRAGAAGLAPVLLALAGLLPALLLWRQPVTPAETLDEEPPWTWLARLQPRLGHLHRRLLDGLAQLRPSRPLPGITLTPLPGPGTRVARWPWVIMALALLGLVLGLLA
ncbi:formate hydrogenlyase subunit 3/Multisubunit Na+ /H+ antiporter, MnhD subunit [Thiohalobacter thiocyanaticus]|uniref:Formate hydrogenlyase subunit 3/Multisubunit Na+ /H+ antiporter, MnhD subunit n=1 Tax=Thiohalobacter thiocyanaticus TaxID=585455 RepID=A0A1Z4VN42_9GAMM|nr:proton-conducting transporter membrane subunit [Thiohalobacter thiocyanaticus]BAZ92852.1 formate hydrogenlyase subunit 3/Multisubunit Na+ /H+ antiporter, MnhD subunit [Thiohalobacter thiocyanaticus]